jgi:hypothetical protein
MTDEHRNRSRRNKLLLLRNRPVRDLPLSTLLTWMRDADEEVRDWATFAVAIRNDDSEEVRRALLERAHDHDFDARSEALVGLARRRDQRSLPLLIEALQEDVVGSLFVEAAAYFAHPDLVKPLEDLRPWWDIDDQLLEEAIQRCSGVAFKGGRAWDVVPANDRDL